MNVPGLNSLLREERARGERERDGEIERGVIKL